MKYFLLLFLFSVSSQAQVFVGYSYAPRLEDSTSGQETKFEARNLFYTGYSKDDWRVQLQYSTESEGTVNGSSSIDTKSYEIIGWGKYLLPLNAAYDIKYYVGGGLGLTWDKVDTTLGAQKIKDTSDREIVLGVIFEGLKFVLPQLSVGSDLKVIYSQYYSKRPTFELGLNIAYYF